jgi:hypothetical protein
MRGALGFFDQAIYLRPSRESADSSTSREKKPNATKQMKQIFKFNELRMEEAP